MMSLVTNEAGESMGQLSFRSHAVASEKVMAGCGSSQVFFTYGSGAGAGKSRAAGASLPPAGDCLKPADTEGFQMLPWTSRSTSSFFLLIRAVREAPQKLQEEEARSAS